MLLLSQSFYFLRWNISSFSSHASWFPLLFPSDLFFPALPYLIKWQSPESDVWFLTIPHSNLQSNTRAANFLFQFPFQYTFLQLSCHDHFHLELMQSPNCPLPPSILTPLSTKNSLSKMSSKSYYSLAWNICGFLWHSVKLPTAYPWPWRPWVIWRKPSSLMLPHSSCSPHSLHWIDSSLLSVPSTCHISSHLRTVPLFQNVLYPIPPHPSVLSLNIISSEILWQSF